MKLKLPEGSWDVEVFLDRSRPDRHDNVLVRIREELPEQSKVFKASQVTLAITAADARSLARALEAVAAQDEAAAGASASRPAPAAPVARPFTKTQGRYLAFIHRYQQRYHCSPAEADIQRHFLVTAPTVNSMVQRLERCGLIARTPGQARSIRLLVPPEQLPPFE
jgi:DNA-binding MarR family transcriptional regulator